MKTIRILLAAFLSSTASFALARDLAPNDFVFAQPWFRCTSTRPDIDLQIITYVSQFNGSSTNGVYKVPAILGMIQGGTWMNLVQTEFSAKSATEMEFVALSLPSMPEYNPTALSLNFTTQKLVLTDFHLMSSDPIPLKCDYNIP